MMSRKKNQKKDTKDSNPKKLANSSLIRMSDTGNFSKISLIRFLKIFFSNYSLVLFFFILFSTCMRMTRTIYINT